MEQGVLSEEAGGRVLYRYSKVLICAVLYSLRCRLAVIHEFLPHCATPGSAPRTSEKARAPEGRRQPVTNYMLKERGYKRHAAATASAPSPKPQAAVLLQVPFNPFEAASYNPPLGPVES